MTQARDFGKLAVTQGLVDDEISRSDWRAKMQKVVGKSGDTYQNIDFRSYLAATKSPITTLKVIKSL